MLITLHESGLNGIKNNTAKVGNQFTLHYITLHYITLHLLAYADLEKPLKRRKKIIKI
jgi:hypothetical protein